MFSLRTAVQRAACGAGLSALLSVALLPQAQAQTATPGALKVGMEISYPPFESYQGDKVVGVDPELAALLGREMKLKPSFADTKFTNLIVGLTGGQHDVVISGMYVTPERSLQADPIPYADTGASILVLKDSAARPQTEKDLCGLKVGLEAGTTWVKALKTLSDEYCVPNKKSAIAVSEFPSAPEASQALLSRNVEAQMEIAGAAKIIVEKAKGRVVITSPALVYPQTLGIYVKKGNTTLREGLEKAMAAIRKSGEYDALIKKYELSPVASK